MSPGTRASPSEPWLVGAAVVYVAVVLGFALAPARALGHDEAVYAVGARGLWSGDAVDELPIHRPIGMPLLAAPGVAAGGDEAVIRIPFAIIALGYVLAVYAIARRLFGPRAGVLAALVQATSAPWLWRAAEALSDIPSALCLLGVAGLCAAEREPATPSPSGEARDPREARRWARAIAAGLLAAAACYIRYASAPVVAAIFLFAFLWGPAPRAWVAAAGGVGFAAMVPFFVWSVDRTGSLFGVLLQGEQMANRAYYGDGLVYYLLGWPYRLLGPLGGALLAIGLVVGLAAWRRGGPDDRARRLLASAALVQLVILGLRAHGEERYVFFATSALVVVGAGWLAARPRWWRAGIIAAAIAAIPSAVIALTLVARSADRRVPFMEAMAAIRGDAAGAPCLVFSTETPMVTWYTGCRAIQVETWGLDPAHAAGTHVYLLEARGLPRSIGDTEKRTRDAVGWQPLACAEPARWCLWRAGAARR